MRQFFSFLIVLFGICLIFFLQQFRVFDLFGVNPNLLLIGFFIIVFIRAPKWIIFGVLVLFLATTYIQARFWFPDFIALSLLVLMVMFAKKYLTGRPGVDFFLSLIFGTALFYGIVGVIENIYVYGLGFGEYFFLAPRFLLKELIYNIFLGAILWALFHKQKLI